MEISIFNRVKVSTAKAYSKAETELIVLRKK